jgi:hypothetical protein
MSLLLEYNNFKNGDVLYENSNGVCIIKISGDRILVYGYLKKINNDDGNVGRSDEGPVRCCNKINIDIIVLNIEKEFLKIKKAMEIPVLALAYNRVRMSYQQFKGTSPRPRENRIEITSQLIQDLQLLYQNRALDPPFITVCDVPFNNMPSSFCYLNPGTVVGVPSGFYRIQNRPEQFGILTVMHALKNVRRNSNTNIRNLPFDLIGSLGEMIVPERVLTQETTTQKRIREVFPGEEVFVDFRALGIEGTLNNLDDRHAELVFQVDSRGILEKNYWQFALACANEETEFFSPFQIN